MNIIMFCRKCGLEVPSFDKDNDRAFARAMDKLKGHMKGKHPQVKKFHNNISWRKLEESRT